jgi:hypothetical protein
VPSGKITFSLPKFSFLGFGMKFPKGINGANANATPPTAKSLKKSRLDKEPSLAEPCSDMYYNMRLFAINDAIEFLTSVFL